MRRGPPMRGAAPCRGRTQPRKLQAQPQHHDEAERKQTADDRSMQRQRQRQRWRDITQPEQAYWGLQMRRGLARRPEQQSRCL